MDRLKGTIYLWTPLIGFDKHLEAYGAVEYLDKLGFTPDAISLFVFNPDIVNLHEAGMKTEQPLPLSNSNYYGSVRNEIREIQQWTNYELRALCRELKKRGVKPLLGIMGVDSGEAEETDLESFAPHCSIRQEWLKAHPELMGSNAELGVRNLNVLKRFRSGDFYEDYLAGKLVDTLKDYEMDGVHFGDAIMPQSANAKYTDYSDDMIGQFSEHTGITLPAEVARSIDNYDKAGMKKRRIYIWNMHRLQWLAFMAWRWEGFVKKTCDTLHAAGKEVCANSFWCTDAFEAYYRYGVDYKALFRSGLDYLLLEDQASSVYVADPSNRKYNMQKYNLMPLMVRAFAPEGRVLGFNAVKDSTEEWSMITHMPGALEREIYSLPNTFLQTKDGLLRSLEGFLICLADGMTKSEWSWLRERYQSAFDDVPRETLTPLMVFSDSHIYDFLPQYIETRRWSHYKQLFEFAGAGGQIGGVVRIEDIDHASGPLFVPNIDILPESEQKKLESYDRGPVVYTSIVDRRFTMPDGKQPEIVIEDPAAEYKMCISGYNLGYIDLSYITEKLGEDDGSPDILCAPKYADDPDYFTADMTYRKVSTGFISTCGRLIRSLYQTPIDTGKDDQVLPFSMDDGRVRLLLANNVKLQYNKPILLSKKRISMVTTYSKFPALPPKLLTRDRRIVVQENEKSFIEYDVIGFIHKIPPHGASIVDVWFAQ